MERFGAFNSNKNAHIQSSKAMLNAYCKHCRDG
jgi:hypothetical protein